MWSTFFNVRQINGMYLFQVGISVVGEVVLAWRELIRKVTVPAKRTINTQKRSVLIHHGHQWLCVYFIHNIRRLSVRE